MAEWLRRWTVNPLIHFTTGSIPVFPKISFVLLGLFKCVWVCLGAFEIVWTCFGAFGYVLSVFWVCLRLFGSV
jgi:hypothetical protein